MKIVCMTDDNSDRLSKLWNDIGVNRLDTFNMLNKVILKLYIDIFFINNVS